jgi:hypothetical protein
MKSEPQVAEQSGKMNNAFRLQEIARLRMIVGFLGEKGQHNWWSSEFFSATAPAFLNPVFGKTTTLAQYHGVKESARRVHDEHIGVGRVFHLFRLPESIEQALFEMLQEPVMTEKRHRITRCGSGRVAGYRRPGRPFAGRPRADRSGFRS